MEIKLILSVFALVGLTFLVWLKMYYVRFSEMRKANLKASDLRPDNFKNIPARIITSGDNFRNLCEIPILFYILIVFILYFDEADSLFVGLSWLFVISRYIHSLIHTTYNKIKHRFMVYAFGALVLWFMWIRFAMVLF